MESLGISKVCQTMLAWLMESQIWHQLAGSVGEGLEKRQRPLLALSPDSSVPPCMPLVTFKPLSWCWSSEGVSLSRWVHVWVLYGELLGAPDVSSTDSIPTGFCSQKLWGLIFLELESWPGGPGVCLELLTPEISILNFYPQHMVGVPAYLCLCPSYQSGWL